MLEKFIKTDVSIIFELNEVVKIKEVAEAYLGPCQTSMIFILIKVFSENS